MLKVKLEGQDLRLFGDTMNCPNGAISNFQVRQASQEDMCCTRRASLVELDQPSKEEALPYTEISSHY